MKKMLAVMLTLALLLTSLAIADGETGSSALEAFYALIGRPQQTETAKAADAYLADVMAGKYAVLPATAEDVTLLAAELDALSDISTKEIAAYASKNQLSVKQVRNAYYKALGNALRADIAVNPAIEADDQYVQTILSLFLSGNAADDAARTEIRAQMTPAAARTIADDADLPDAFVAFLIMDASWEDDRWDNDDDWMAAVRWDDTNYVADNTDDLEIGDRDSKNSTLVADMQEKLIALGYLTGKADGIFGTQTREALLQYQRANGLKADGVFNRDDANLLLGKEVVARWDYDDSFDDTPAYMDTPNVKTSGGSTGTNSNGQTGYYDTPDNTPDRTPDNTPDRNTPDNTPDNTRDNTPDNTP